MKFYSLIDIIVSDEEKKLIKNELGRNYLSSIKTAKRISTNRLHSLSNTLKRPPETFCIFNENKKLNSVIDSLTTIINVLKSENVTPELYTASLELLEKVEKEVNKI